MTTPGGIGPERLGDIVNGAAPRDEEERALLVLMEETRALQPGASEELRRRVLDGPPPRRATRWESARAWLGSASGRRGLLVGAPVVAGIIALAVAIPALDGGGHPSPAPGDAAEATSTTTTPARGSARAAAAPEAAPASDSAKAAAPVAPAAAGAAGLATPAPTGPDARRAQQVTATTRVQVKDVEALSRASTSAMRTVRALGGFTASSDYSVPNGAEGTNRLVFRVPVDRAQDALAAFGRLGTVTGQSADIVDLTERLDRQSDAVTRLEAEVADLRAKAAAQPGDAAIAADLARAEAVLGRARAARAATLERVDRATLRLTLTTERPPPPATSAGRFGGPLSRAGGRLADAAAWLLGALVLVGPFLVVGGAALWGVSRLRGRADRRLMGSA